MIGVHRRSSCWPWVIRRRWPVNTSKAIQLYSSATSDSQKGRSCRQPPDTEYFIAESQRARPTHKAATIHHTEAAARLEGTEAAAGRIRNSGGLIRTASRSHPRQQGRIGKPMYELLTRRRVFNSRRLPKAIRTLAVALSSGQIENRNRSAGSVNRGVVVLEVQFPITSQFISPLR